MIKKGDKGIKIYYEVCRVFQVGLYQFEKDIVYTRKEDYCKILFDSYSIS